MNIRSKFRDYYDNAVRYGIDHTLLYARFSAVHDFEKLKNGKLPEGGWMISSPSRDYSMWERERKPYCGEFIIGFCGQLYQGVHVVYPAKPFEKETHQYLYGVKAQEYLKANHNDPYDWRYPRREKPFSRFPVEPVKIGDDLFREVNAPIFAIEHAEAGELGDNRYGGTKLTTNICLKDFEFGKCVDAFTTFQEIAMYLSNQLVSEKKVDDVEDKYRIAQHGFDKYSFRHPTRLSKLK